MRTQPIVLASAIWLLVLSLVCLFAPAQVAAQFGISVPDQATVPVQILGATFLGLGLLNWVSRRSSVGGIYGRPLVVANLAHYCCGSFVLFGALANGLALVPVFVTVAYACLALAFGWLLFGPRSTHKSPPN
jgi:hypothetical protein